MEKHKCQDCGFLAARDINTRVLDEVEKSVRDTGKPKLVKSIQALSQNWGPDTPKNEELLICFKQKRDLIAEAQSIPANVLQVIQTEKECDSFTDWKQGFNPKEHQEMLDRQRMLDYQAKRDKEDKDFRLQMAKDERDWREKQETRHSKEENNRTILTWGVAVFAAIAGGIVGRFIH